MNERNCNGVRFKDSDYAGLLTRVAIFGVDFIVIFGILLIGFFLDINVIAPNSEAPLSYGSLAAIVMAFFYLTSVKLTKIGTLGQMVTRTQVLTLSGERPSFLRMVCRLLFWILGPITFVSDLIFLTTIKEKRALRDCYCETIVVRKGAEPVERNLEIRVVRSYAIGLNVMYRSAYGLGT